MRRYGANPSALETLEIPAFGAVLGGNLASVTLVSDVNPVV